MKHFIYISIFVVLVTSCKPAPTSAPFPVITLENYVFYGPDSMNFFINFKDGNGQIGNLIGDDSSNYITMLYLHKVNGTFVPVLGFNGSQVSTNRFRKPTDTIQYNYSILGLTPYEVGGQTIQGQINVQMGSAIHQTPPYLPSDSVFEYQITLWDRAGNQSNTITTKPILVPKQ